MATKTLQEVVEIRKCKKALYVSLLRNFNFLSQQEVKLLRNLSVDEDILLLLENGDDLNS